MDETSLLTAKLSAKQVVMSQEERWQDATTWRVITICRQANVNIRIPVTVTKKDEHLASSN